MTRRVYLGDGVYVTLNAGAGTLTLTTENGVDVTNTIMLDDVVWQNLIDFVQAHTRAVRHAAEPRDAIDD